MSCIWLTPKQSAEKLQVTTSAIYRWIRNKELVYSLTPGGAIRICEGNLVHDNYPPPFADPPKED